MNEEKKITRRAIISFIVYSIFVLGLGAWIGFIIRGVC